MSSNVNSHPVSAGLTSKYRDAAQAAHEKHCGRCRAATEAAADRRRAIGRLNRLEHKQLGLILDMRTEAVSL
ncbi:MULTISPECIES: hypothetical protein [Streptomyces]|uniref:Uncharacterized protein n=1 Tax=Streptomyces venezuelae (strain ATCC 10712 / CBS 650.69 / DSM 40230 / JCM 4526 / NBRC 13096 / PD 04745) TaxID=953739 RepID=F2RKX0_STRVP|nr:hypothetical protein [Streptomyces venezuelae]APE21341.1 hypothetical protein vnz_10135 [Streptomyces venezuelae]QER98731.1 hypothetical protein DEJ43_10260 [Streptomyces venezuelae ATCC 10712]CCA55359.1 hypothetical protein SVEN_2073 [Streptomyces venezuelae ATCC 10712]